VHFETTLKLGVTFRWHTWSLSGTEEFQSASQHEWLDSVVVHATWKIVLGLKAASQGRVKGQPRVPIFVQHGESFLAYISEVIRLRKLKFGTNVDSDKV
jgi:hypothetical protein